jgi:hypothetical protein
MVRCSPLPRTRMHESKPLPVRQSAAKDSATLAAVLVGAAQRGRVADGGSQRSVDLALIPRCRDGATAADYLAVLRGPSGLAGPRTGAAAEKPPPGGAAAIA